MLVVVLDIMGQGMIIPVITTLLLDSDQSFLKPGTSSSDRQLYYGATMGVVYFSWFLGATYFSRLSDFIGRKQGLLICLGGAFFGYVMTIVSLYLASLPLLILARAITGFTAGNQPIAQAALVDMSADDNEKGKNLGLVVVGMSLGLMAGPMLGGLLSDKDIVGAAASMELPFIVAGSLIILNILLITFTYHNVNFIRQHINIRVTDVFTNLLDVRKRPLIIRLSLVFFFSQLGLNCFYVFVDNYLYSQFKFDTMENSIMLVIFGGAMAMTGAFLVAPLFARYTAKKVMLGSCLVMLLGVFAFMLNPVPILSYVLMVPIVVAFGVNYPQMITLFSHNVDESEQGWVMGVTFALFTLGTGMISLVGGKLMGIDIRLPFMVSIGSFAVAFLLVFLFWRGKAMD
ncbi:MAG: MFS transporter [Gammaproteobacteria bacterium]|nr:MFS transporter [Gammaproteobacteria bacterium]